LCSAAFISRPLGTTAAIARYCGTCFKRERSKIVLHTVLVVILILLLVGALPTWGYSRGWGYAPSGLLGTVLIILLILFLLGRV
jgi:Protein of unknown function (DUF3309)